jgi:hypothetical protein
MEQPELGNLHGGRENLTEINFKIVITEQVI